MKTNCINILITYGYKVSYDNVILAIKNNISIDNLEKFNIKVDDKIEILTMEELAYKYGNNKWCYMLDDGKEYCELNMCKIKDTKCKIFNQEIVSNSPNAQSSLTTLKMKEVCKSY